MYLRAHFAQRIVWTMNYLYKLYTIRNQIAMSLNERSPSLLIHVVGARATFSEAGDCMAGRPTCRCRPLAAVETVEWRVLRWRWYDDSRDGSATSPCSIQSSSHDWHPLTNWRDSGDCRQVEFVGGGVERFSVFIIASPLSLECVRFVFLLRVARRHRFILWTTLWRNEGRYLLRNVSLICSSLNTFYTLYVHVCMHVGMY